MTHGEVRLNLGSGGVATPGWVCIDRSPNIVLSRYPRLKRGLYRAGLLQQGHLAAWDPAVTRGDITSLNFGDASVDAVYSSHVLEHIHLESARQVLAEAQRVLKQGAILRLALPDAVSIARDLIDGEAAGDINAGQRFNERLLAHPSRPARGIRALVGRAGGHVHLWQPTRGMLEGMLREAGFVEIMFCEFHSGNLPDLVSIETRRESFFVEARAT